MDLLVLHPMLWSEVAMTNEKEKLRYISTDHKTFCIKHRLHSVTYSLCPECFDEREAVIKELVEAAKRALETIVKEWAYTDEGGTNVDIEVLQLKAAISRAERWGERK